MMTAAKKLLMIRDVYDHVKLNKLLA